MTGLYIHIPFCEKKCPYCDFNTYAGLDTLFQDTVDALCLEMARWCAPLHGRTIRTLFLGGGTPSILTLRQLEQLFNAVHQNFHLADDCEITSEVNPGVVDRQKFEGLRNLGVNRLSMGVQSFQPQELRFLGRIHDVGDVFRAYDAARAAGFDNVNLDFIFGLPNQPLNNWQDTLEKALTLAPEHLSLYSLIVEPNTPLHHWVQTGQAAAPNDDDAADHYEFAIDRLADVGYQQYEVSNWAKTHVGNYQEGNTDQEDKANATLSKTAEIMPRLACQHNLIYWRNDEYLGIGPGAHSHLRLPQADDNINIDHIYIDRRWGNRKPVAGYVKRITQGNPVEEFSETLAPPLARGETMMLGLRLLQEGVAFDRFAQLHSIDLRIDFAAELAELQAQGLITTDEQRVQLTDHGLMMGNRVFAHFLPAE